MFLRNLAAFTDALGVENAPAIITFSLLPWESDDHRNAFIKDLTGINIPEKNAYGS
jgi:hypothetical protein